MSDNEQHAGADAYKFNSCNFDSNVNPDFSLNVSFRDYEVISDASTIPNLEHMKLTEHESTGNFFNRLLVNMK